MDSSSNQPNSSSPPHGDLNNEQASSGTDVSQMQSTPNNPPASAPVLPSVAEVPIQAEIQPSQSKITTTDSSSMPPVPPSIPSDPSPVLPNAHSSKPHMLIMPLAVLLLGVLTGAALFVSGVFKNNTLRLGQFISASPTQQVVVKKEKIVIGTDATYPPMEYKEANGDLVGFDVDLAKEVGTQLGLEVEFRDISFDEVFNSLDAKEIDLIMSSVTITEDRKHKYNFSEPYINAGQVIVTRRDSLDRSMTPEELLGKRVGVQKGTTSEEEALKYTSKALVMTYADYPLAVDALTSSKIDAIIIDLTAAKGLVDTNSNLKIASDPFTNEYYGVVFRKEDTELKADVDKVILSLQKRGVLNNIKQKWFQ